MFRQATRGRPSEQTPYPRETRSRFTLTWKPNLESLSFASWAWTRGPTGWRCRLPAQLGNAGKWPRRPTESKMLAACVPPFRAARAPVMMDS
jgi:hypothetical protein